MTSKSLLPPSWEVPAEFRKRLGDKIGRQRTMDADGHLLLVLHACPGIDEGDRRGRFFWRKPDGTWAGNESSGGTNTLTKHLAEFGTAIEAIDNRLDAADDAKDYFDVMSALSPLLRTVRNLHKTLQAARETLNDDREVINARDRAYELERAAELLYEDARNGLEFVMARRTEEQAAAGHRMAVSSHRLNLMAAFFFPVATLATVFGTNMIHGFEGENVPFPAPWPFLIMIAVGIGMGLILTLFMSIKRDLPALPKGPLRNRLDDRYSR
jgi:hypothetical protein